MVSTNVQKLLEEVSKLSIEERRQLRSFLDKTTTLNPALRTDESLARILLERGIIRQIRPRPTEVEIAQFRMWRPVPIKGKPLSQTIIEDRR